MAKLFLTQPIAWFSNGWLSLTDGRVLSIHRRVDWTETTSVGDVMRLVDLKSDRVDWSHVDIISDNEPQEATVLVSHLVRTQVAKGNLDVFLVVRPILCSAATSEKETASVASEKAATSAVSSAASSAVTMKASVKAPAIHAQTDATSASATSASEAIASGAALSADAAEAKQEHNLFPQHLHFAGQAELADCEVDGGVCSLRVLIGVTAETDATIAKYGVSYSQVADTAAKRRSMRMVAPMRGIDPRPLVVARPPHALGINPMTGAVHVYTDCDGECATLAFYNLEECANMVFNAKLKASDKSADKLATKPLERPVTNKPADNEPATKRAKPSEQPATTDNKPADNKPATKRSEQPTEQRSEQPTVLDACVAQIAARVTNCCDLHTELTVMEAVASNPWNHATRAQLLEDALHAYMQKRITPQTAIKVLREIRKNRVDTAMCVAKYAQAAGHADVRSAACAVLHNAATYSTYRIVDVASLVVEICAADPSACAGLTAEMQLLLTCVDRLKPAFFVPGVVRTIVASLVSTPIANTCPTSLHTLAMACAAERDRDGARDQDGDGARDTRLRDLATAADALPAVLAHVRASHANKPTVYVAYVHTAAYFAALLMEHTLDDAQFLQVMAETPQLLDAPTENPLKRGVHSRILFDMRVRFAALSEKKAEGERKQVQAKLAKFDAQQQELQELRAKLAAVSLLVTE